MTGLTQRSRDLTRLVMLRLQSLPTPVKAVIGLLPGGGTALEAAENHKWALIKLARYYADLGKLSPHAKDALSHYDIALAAESRAYERLITILQREV